MISLLHGTARPGRWQEICSQWFQNCDNPKNVEYVLVYERKNFSGVELYPNRLGWSITQTLLNEGRACVVDAYNLAADLARGNLLFYLADDFWSMPHWDTDILSFCTNNPRHIQHVYWVNTGEGADKINHPLWTRAYQESKGFFLAGIRRPLLGH